MGKFLKRSKLLIFLLPFAFEVGISNQMVTSKIGELFLLIRPRWEYTEIKNNGASTANAGTVRTQLGVKLDYNPFRFYMENTAVIVFYDKYSPLNPTYDFVPDEPRMRITQLWGEFYRQFFNLRVGRQVINIDNQRFIGAVNWRQTPQTFDAVRVDLKGDNLRFKPQLTAAYICDRQGVLSSLTTYKICGNAPLSYSAFGYISFQPLKSHRGALYAVHYRKFADAYGVNLKGSFEVNTVSISYRAEYAYENVHNKVKNLYGDAHYLHLKAQTSAETPYGVPSITLGYERLGRYFVTPFATLHKFNGWADVFLVYTATSNQYGLNDYYFSLSLARKGFGKVGATYHKFTATEDFPGGGNNFGTELDLIYTKKIFKNLSFVAKAAKYWADDEAKKAGVGDKDTTKMWLMLTYTFRTTF